MQSFVWVVLFSFDAMQSQLWHRPVTVGLPWAAAEEMELIF